MAIGRKDPCPCGSGKRYKHCCGAQAQAATPGRAQAQAVFADAHRAHLAGRKGEAAQGYRAALGLDPDHPEALHYLGMLLFEAGQLAQAQAMVARSLQLNGRDADFWANSALVEQAAGRPDAAVDAYRRSLDLTPNDAERRMLLGSLLLQQGQAEAARAELERATWLDPKLGQAWFLLGNARMHVHPVDFDQAIADFRRSLTLMPDNVEPRVSLSTALAYTQRLEEAREVLEEATRVDPDHPKIWANLGSYWIDLNDAGRAVECLERALVLQPEQADAEMELGAALKMRGDFDAARRHFERAAAIDPGNLSALASQIAHERYRSADDPDLIEARRRADTAQPGQGGLPALCFALGAALDRIGEYDAAFGYYARGNALRAETGGFDREAYRREVDRRIAQFDRARIDALAAWGDPSARPIFIVGMPRSGTTLTEQILASHSRVVAGGERTYWPQVERKSLPDGWPRDAEQARALTDAYLTELEQVADTASADHVTDKMPDNFKRVGLLHALFPDARIIHVRRHPVDNCLSIFFQNFRGHDYSRRLEDLAFYRREYERLMAHWRTVMPPERYFEFDYEALVADQETVTRQLLAFCGLDWEDACLSFHENRSTVKTASIWQVRQKLYTGSVERWRHYEAHIGPLLSLLDD